MCTSLSTKSPSLSSRWRDSRATDCPFCSKLEAALAGCICERLYAPMIKITTAVEDHLFDAFFHRALRDQLSHGGGRRDVIALLLAATGAFARTCRGDGL